VSNGAARRARLLDIVTAPSTLVLLGAYLALCALYGWQASQRATLTIFSDEIELTQLSRAIAETGHAALRGGSPPHGFPGLTAYLIAPWWWAHDVGTAYAGIKLTGVAVMTAVLFPAYALGRLVLSRGWAVAAAIGAAATPALAYAPFLVEEPLSYPVATLSLLVTTRLLAAPSWRRGLLAVAVAGAGVLVRGQLVLLLIVLGVACLVLAWQSGRCRRVRASWDRGDWFGAGVLAVGVLIVANALIAHRSLSWYTTTTFFKERILHYAVWATSAFAIGLGLLPVIAGGASLARRPGRSTPAERSLAIVTGTALVVFVFYAGVKGAYLSTTFADLIVERNLIYLAPPLLVGAALFLSRRDSPVWAVLVATAAVLYVVVTSPYSLVNYPNYEAHGLAIAAFANRVLRWPDGTIQTVLVVVALSSAALLAAVALTRSARLARALAVVGAALVVSWSLTGEIYAAHGEKIAADRQYEALPKPANWLDREIRSGKAVFIGQQIADANPLWQLEFWNRSLSEFWSLDATAPGPGRVSTPDLGAPDGTLRTTPLFGERYVVAGPGVDLAGRTLSRVGDYRLYATAPDGHIRLATSQTGVYPDGWMGSAADYTQYDVPSGSFGFARVSVSREAWCGKDIPGHVRVAIGPVRVDPQRQAIVPRVTARAAATIHSCKRKVFLLRTPPGPWRVHVSIDPTFSPHAIDPGIGDARQLGARVDFGYLPLGT